MKYLFYERSRRSTVYLSPLDLRSRVDKYSTSSRTLIKQIFHFNNTYNRYYCNSTITWPYSKKLIGWKLAKSVLYIFRYDRKMWFKYRKNVIQHPRLFFIAEVLMYDLVEQSNKKTKTHQTLLLWFKKEDTYLFRDHEALTLHKQRRYKR